MYQNLWKHNCSLVIIPNNTKKNIQKNLLNLQICLSFNEWIYEIRLEEFKQVCWKNTFSYKARLKSLSFIKAVQKMADIWQHYECLTISWWLPNDCLTQPDDCLTTAWWLPDECLTNAWRLPDDCLTTAWWLLEVHLQQVLTNSTSVKIGGSQMTERQKL